MRIRNLKIYNNHLSTDLPDWIIFAFELGSYLYDNRLINGKPSTILLSLPTEQYFPLFVAMGIAERRFSATKQVQSIKEQVMRLKTGNRIIINDRDLYKEVSVHSVGPSLVEGKNEMLLWIQDGNVKRGVPESQWIEKLILKDEKYDEIKRARRVSKKKRLGLEGNAILTKMYTNEQLNKVSFFPGDFFYIIGNLSQLHEQMNEEIFVYDDIKGKIKDFLYIDNNSSYTNGKLFSTYMEKIDREIVEDIPTIYSDVGSYSRQSKNFINNPTIIIYNRTANENRLFQVKEELKRRMIQEGLTVITNEILEYLKIKSTNIPKGIELLAWR